MPKDMEEKNDDFFAAKNASLGKEGSEASEEMVKGLLEKGDVSETGDDNIKNKKDEVEYVVVDEGEEVKKETDKEVSDDELKAAAKKKLPVTDPRIDSMVTAVEGLTTLQRQQIESQKTVDAVAADPEPELDALDPDSLKSWTDWNRRDARRESEAAIDKYHREQVLPIQNLALSRELTTQINECKVAFGDRFDYEKDKEAIQEVQMQFPAASISDAFKSIDYARMKNDMQNQLDGQKELANSQTIKSGPASKTIQEQVNQIVLTATDEDREMAENFGLDIKEYLKMRHDDAKDGGKILL